MTDNETTETTTDERRCCLDDGRFAEDAAFFAEDGIDGSRADDEDAVFCADNFAEDCAFAGN